jgi:hypothetical protein
VKAGEKTEMPADWGKGNLQCCRGLSWANVTGRDIPALLAAFDLDRRDMQERRETVKE